MSALLNRSTLLAGALSLLASLPLCAVETNAAEEVVVKAHWAQAPFPASAHQSAVIGKRPQAAEEPARNTVESMLPITEHQYESLEPKSKLLGLPISSVD